MLVVGILFISQEGELYLLVRNKCMQFTWNIFHVCCTVCLDGDTCKHYLRDVPKTVFWKLRVSRYICIAATRNDGQNPQ